MAKEYKHVQVACPPGFKRYYLVYTDSKNGTHMTVISKAVAIVLIDQGMPSEG